MSETPSSLGNPSRTEHSWRAFVLANLEQGNVADLYDFNKNWWENTAAIATEAAVFKCPTALPPMGGYANIDGPTRDSDSAANELMNRLKFGIEGAAFTGAFGAARASAVEDKDLSSFSKDLTANDHVLTYLPLKNKSEYVNIDYSVISEGYTNCLVEKDTFGVLRFLFFRLGVIISLSLYGECSKS